jgi:hypothetical protein
MEILFWGRRGSWLSQPDFSRPTPKSPSVFAPTILKSRADVVDSTARADLGMRVSWTNGGACNDNARIHCWPLDL